MIFRHATFLSASVLALTLGLQGAAHAQQAPRPTPPVAPAQDDDEEATTVDEVVVTGVRAAVASALQVKRANDQISDSIVAEDIGKLPDNNVTEALSRVTGVQVQRSQGEGFQTLVRGLPNVVTTLNGRNIFTTAGRGISLADVPADLLQRVDVYKTAIPENISGGIAGGINVQLRRPFDFPGFTAAGTVRTIYSDQSESSDPNGSALISDRWDTGAGEFGALFSVSHQEREFQENNTFNGTYFTRPRPTGGPGTTSDLVRPDVAGYIYTLGERTRDSAELALQWRPNDDLELYFDGFYVDFQNDSELNFLVGLPVFIGLTPTNYTLQDGSNVLQTLTGTNAFTKTSNQAFEDQSETYQFALGGRWDATERLTLTGDVAYTKSTAENRNVILDTAFIVPTIRYDFDDDGAVNIDARNADGTPYNLANPGEPFFLDQYFENRGRQEGDELAVMGDAEYRMEGFFTAIKGGLRYASRTGASDSTDPSGSFAPFDRFRVRNILGLTGRAGIEGVSPAGILDGARDLNSRQFFVADRDFLLGNADVLRPLFGRVATAPAFDPARFFDDKEDSIAGYVQGRFESEIGGVSFDGMIGLRVERTESELSGFAITTPPTGPRVVTPLTVDKTDTEYLPSLNVRFELTGDLDLRFGAARTVTRPFFGDLNPAVSLTTPAVGVAGTGSGGNPLLDNVQADSYDLSLEWYFDDGSLLSGTLFYRDIAGFVVRTSSNETINGQVFAVTRPQSAGAGNLQGAEFALTHFFRDLPGLLDGLGVQLNATFIDGETELPGGIVRPFGNVSEFSYNAVLIYERGPFSSRLAYNWRDEHISSFNQVGVQPTSVFVAPQGFLDFSASYRLNDNFTLSFDAVNILDEEIVNYFGGRGENDQDLYPRDVASWERTFSIGLRARF